MLTDGNSSGDRQISEPLDGDETMPRLSTGTGTTRPDDEPPIPETLQDLIARLETDSSPRDEYDFRGPVHALGRALQDRGESVPRELIAEEIAFSIHAHDHQSPSSWDLYFGPLMSWSTATGEQIDSPSLAMMTPDVLAHWRQRAGETPHPIMQARYADLLWELPKRLEGVKPDASMGRVAVDAYLDAVTAGRYEHQVTAIGKAKRALDIALSVGDQARVERARDVLLALEEKVAEDDSPGLWGFCFDTFVEPPNKRAALTPAQRDKLVADLEARLTRFAAREPDQYHPVGAEAAALRLAHHYRRTDRREDVARVLRTFGSVVRRMRGAAPSLLPAHSLEQLYDQFKAFELHSDADALGELIRLAGEEAVGEMKEISVKTEISPEKVEEYFAAMLAGSGQEVILRLTVHFIPKREALEAQLRELAQKAPISYLMTRTIKDEEGRSVAYVGPLESDLEGQLLSHISQNMQLSVPWLRQLISRALDRGLLTADGLLEFVFACPLFQPKRRALLEAGLAAYIREDSMAAVHILVPQVEQALRQLAVLVGAPIYTQRRGGGLHVRTLDDLLRDDAVEAALGDSIVSYLRVFVTDARGWNVRNTVCHGLAPVGMLTMPVADRVVHALLVLALVRQQQEGEEGPTGSLQPEPR